MSTNKLKHFYKMIFIGTKLFIINHFLLFIAPTWSPYVKTKSIITWEFRIHKDLLICDYVRSDFY